VFREEQNLKPIKDFYHDRAFTHWKRVNLGTIKVRSDVKRAAIRRYGAVARQFFEERERGM